MGNSLTTGRTKAIIDTALRASEKAARANYIDVVTADDRSHVTLTTVIEQKALAWIDYDAGQLDELIRVLSAHRADLR